ncbi:Glycosyltransferase involved in cell wall bisynthesis [Ekhidna lutea]|uniref:Glycosyltransferase involved in cell wall bisynthesis n=1 Tax=Ekhidna lutea TaxID=447679 RepID=A0A239K2N2_EKHLU|nr:glycosyltransferase [Ekhidna lutea]SNT12646.1 Glycosyltransferase involved in cell wall bisynthesis [Ekhidna lutea]
MNQLPLVSVICLCHNHASFVAEAIASVWKQSYPNIELIVVDDGSSDDSKSIIASTIKEKKEVQFIDIGTSLGNCAAFNQGFAASKGEYIIDLAADDILLPERVLGGVNTFIKSGAGVTFCDVMNIDESGHELGTHYKRDSKGNLLEKVPEGDIYQELISRYFISPPGMMIARSVLEGIGGYDETLSYEDFDFWIRSSRSWSYAFTDEVLVKKRIVKESLSSQQFKFRSIHQASTLKVCQKIKELNITRQENSALSKRCLYEIKQCIKQGNISLIPEFIKLL